MWDYEEDNSEKERPFSLLHLIRSMNRLVIHLLWLVVFFIILAGVGRYLWVRAIREEKGEKAQPKSAQIITPQDWGQIDKAIAEALHEAHDHAQQAACERLDTWVAGLMERVDADFLPWYFGYWNQQVLGLKSMWYWASNKVFDDAPSAAERLTEDIQREFAKRVLRPEIAQLELERMTREVVEIYVAGLQSGLSRIPAKYNVPQAKWDDYLRGVSVLASGAEGNRSVGLSLKTLTATSLAATVGLLQKSGFVFAKIGGKVSAKLAAKAAAKTAAKTGGTVAAEGGGKLLGPIIAIGIIAWDVWDHQTTKKAEMPILRQNVLDYFTELKKSLLDDPEEGVMTVIFQIEGSILKSL